MRIPNCGAVYGFADIGNPEDLSSSIKGVHGGTVGQSPRGMAPMSVLSINPVVAELVDAFLN